MKLRIVKRRGGNRVVGTWDRVFCSVLQLNRVITGLAGEKCHCLVETREKKGALSEKGNPVSQKRNLVKKVNDLSFFFLIRSLL